MNKYFLINGNKVKNKIKRAYIEQLITGWLFF